LSRAHNKFINNDAPDGIGEIYMLEVKKIAHASVMITTGEKHIYIDPFYSDSLPTDVRSFYDDAPKGDLLLITHRHHDHCDPETFHKIIDEDTTIIAPKNCSDKIDGDFISLKVGKSIEVNGIEVEAVHAYNIKRKRDSGEPFHPKGKGVGYLVKVEGKIIYHSGDTEYIPEMDELKNVHTALLPIDGHYTMDIDEAAEAAKSIRPKLVIPMHERDVDPDIFKRKLEGVPDIEVRTM